MGSPFLLDGGRDNPIDDVVAVELTIDGVLVVADKLNLADFPPSLGIRLNIPYADLRELVWEQVIRDLTAQGVLDVFGAPHPAVADMLDILSRPERTLECRWWRRDLGGTMIRFAVSRKGNRHVIAVRRDDMVVLQRVATKIGLGGMVTTVLGDAQPASIEPLTALASEIAKCRTMAQLSKFDISAASARTYADAIGDPASWVEITAVERHPGGTSSQTQVAAGVLDSAQGRIVSIPRRVQGELYGSFLPGTSDNLQRALDGLVEHLPSGSWFEPEPDTVDGY
jgi:hypothetical protein